MTEATTTLTRAGCFGCGPDVPDGLSEEQLLRIVDTAKEQLPSLKLLAISGGECYLLGDRLLNVIRRAKARGLIVRTVSNGFWGKSLRAARRLMAEAREAGLSELNLSTGRDHAKFVPVTSVVNAAQAAVEAGVLTFMTVEEDAADSGITDALTQDPTLVRLGRDFPNLFRIGVNTWMKFTDSHQKRNPERLKKMQFGGCHNLLTTLVATPTGRVKACCGLTSEYIPELTIGDVANEDWRAMHAKATNDFVKVWLFTDGPVEILRKLGFGSGEFEHHCQACAFLHRDKAAREALVERSTQHMEDVLIRFHFKARISAQNIWLC
jgi:hypothetical protein